MTLAQQRAHSAETRLTAAQMRQNREGKQSVAAWQEAAQKMACLPHSRRIDAVFAFVAATMTDDECERLANMIGRIPNDRLWGRLDKIGEK